MVKGRNGEKSLVGKRPNGEKLKRPLGNDRYPSKNNQKITANEKR